MTNTELDAWCRSNWNKIPEDRRKKCIDHLKRKIPPEVLQGWKNDGVGKRFHFWGGMAVRNTLREVMLDEELPAVPYDGGESYSNWDDYYTGALQELLETVT